MKKTGWVLSILFAVFILAASVAPKLIGSQLALEPLTQIGWPTQYVYLIGAIELICVMLILLPNTSLLGAILMTGLLGGALASHLRAGSPLLSHTLFSLYLGAFMWSSVWLRDDNIRKVFPFSSRKSK